MNLPELKKVIDSESGKALKEFLIEKLLEMRDIANIKEYSVATQQMYEIKAQKRAYEKMKEILSMIVTIESSDMEHADKDEFFAL